MKAAVQNVAPLWRREQRHKHFNDVKSSNVLCTLESKQTSLRPFDQMQIMIVSSGPGILRVCVTEKIVAKIIIFHLIFKFQQCYIHRTNLPRLGRKLVFRESVRRDPFNQRFCEYRLLLTVEGSVFDYTLFKCAKTQLRTTCGEVNERERLRKPTSGRCCGVVL